VRSAERQDFTPPLSLVHAWRGVRQWRSLFETESVGFAGEVLHAHCFSAGMAGVRAGLPVVYDFREPVGTGANAGPWLTRSLRIAEGFVLSRAAAVVVHSQRMWDVAVAQGVRTEDLFHVPDPVPPVPPTVAVARPSGDALTFFASADIALDLLLRAFALVAEELDNVELVVDRAAAELEQRASELGIFGRVRCVSAQQRDRVLACADVVIAGPSADGPNPIAIAAMAHGRTLLAADAAPNREVSAHGRGCLWYSSANERDLAFRAAFLARNPDFRAALGCNGRDHLHATRGPAAVAHSYDEVYRHALLRHGGGGRRDGMLHVPAYALC
jgi:glycosyltransferase involved in cell wall biosynthesis